MSLTEKSQLLFRHYGLVVREYLTLGVIQFNLEKVNVTLKKSENGRCRKRLFPTRYDAMDPLCVIQFSYNVPSYY